MIDLKAGGWTELPDDGFVGYVGPFFYRELDQQTLEFALPAEPKHRNLRGNVQGGVYMTFADRTMGIVARRRAAPHALATIQMDTQFVDEARIGELLTNTPTVIRATKSVIFMRTDVMAGGRCVAHASAVFKITKGSQKAE